jgi:hypothetical protein
MWPLLRIKKIREQNYGQLGKFVSKKQAVFSVFIQDAIPTVQIEFFLKRI